MSLSSSSPASGCCYRHIIAIQPLLHSSRQSHSSGRSLQRKYGYRTRRILWFINHFAIKHREICYSKRIHAQNMRPASPSTLQSLCACITLDFIFFGECHFFVNGKNNTIIHRRKKWKENKEDGIKKENPKNNRRYDFILAFCLRKNISKWEKWEIDGLVLNATAPSIAAVATTASPPHSKQYSHMSTKHTKIKAISSELTSATKYNTR